MATIAKKLWLSAEIAYELVRVRICTKRALQEALGRSHTFDAGVRLSADQRGLVSEIARLIWVFGRRSLLGFTCLHRSVAALRILRRREVESRLVIAPVEGGRTPSCVAHAWVEVVGGQTIGHRVNDAPIFILAGCDVT